MGGGEMACLMAEGLTAFSSFLPLPRWHSGNKWPGLFVGWDGAGGQFLDQEMAAFHIALENCGSEFSTQAKFLMTGCRVHCLLQSLNQSFFLSLSFSSNFLHEKCCFVLCSFSFLRIAVLSHFIVWVSSSKRKKKRYFPFQWKYYFWWGG